MTWHIVPNAQYLILAKKLLIERAGRRDSLKQQTHQQKKAKDKKTKTIFYLYTDRAAEKKMIIEQTKAHSNEQFF